MECLTFPFTLRMSGLYHSAVFSEWEGAQLTIFPESRAFEYYHDLTR